MKKILAILFFLNSLLVCFSQEGLVYQKPPKEIVDLVDVERAPNVLMDSKNEYMVFTYRKMYKNLEDLSQEEIKLAGLRINPKINISSTVTYFNNIKVKKFTENTEVQVQGLPTQAKIANLTWSPDEQFIAFTHSSSVGLECWVLNVKEAKAWKVCDEYLNGNLGTPISWFKDSQSLLIKTISKERKSLRTNNELPTGPTVSISEKGEKAQNRTFQDLLKNKIDEENFEILTSSELKQVKLNGSVFKWKEAAIYWGVSFSPDGHFVLLNIIEKPFSYIVPYYRFPNKTIVFDNRGKLTKEVNIVPLTEVLPKGFMAVRKGKRNMEWRADKPATLYFVTCLDEGNPEKEVSFRDEVFSWDAPFQNDAVSIVKTEQRFNGVEWGNDQYAIVSDEWWTTRNTKSYLFNPSDATFKPIVIDNRNSQDEYKNPGQAEMKRTDWGTYILDIYKESIYLLGEGYTEKGQFPFIDQFSLKTQSKKRIYQSEYTDKKETLLGFIDIEKGIVLCKIESKNEFPNYYKRDISLKSKKNKVQQLTQFPNPFKSIETVKKELITYKRKDGVELSGTLYLPLQYEKGKKYPLIMWAYPQEFKDKNSAGQVTSNPNEFVFPFYGSPIYWVTRGYVVLDDAAFPILGEGKEEPNDKFIEQLKDNAEAAINELDKRGIIDRTKVAVGGHSYGAFMTANLLTHTDLFVCGVARSGAYNRTLTPFGFQSEERSYWDAPQVYNTMSPFMNADKMNHHLLLIHGDADNNPGTFTLQSERYFHALKGLGKSARLVVLPKESHGYVAIESILHVLWEQDTLFEKYLKENK
ncbi:MAG: S9 family peptidase [Flavobacteriia bacterium]|nr:S9 family peptidase [Flavobacteriia bacterium]